MRFTSLLDFFFVTLTLIGFIALGIDDFVQVYASFPRLLGVVCFIFLLLFLWRFGKMVVTYINTYLETRTIHSDLVVLTKNLVKETLRED